MLKRGSGVRTLRKNCWNSTITEYSKWVGGGGIALIGSKSTMEGGGVTNPEGNCMGQKRDQVEEEEPKLHGESQLDSSKGPEKNGT